jgi:Tfp pilus assembly protein PilF
MGIIFKTEDRRIIPRWRSYELAASTGELSLNSLKSNPLNFNAGSFLLEQKKAWKVDKTLMHAGDLLSSAFVLGLQSQFIDVAKFVIEKSTDAYSPLLELANKTLNINKDINEKVSLFDTPLNNQKLQNEIKVLKHILHEEPKNPIAWMEIGRLYSLIGQMDKANKSIEVALHLDKNNRFIARSASRFYHHFSGDKEKALYVIKNSDFLKSDPWMLSAEIAYSTILGRHSKMAKIGADYLKNEIYNDFSTTELASAVGTLEYNNGKLKNARKLFNQSLIQPNDNSLAQIMWMSENLNGLNINDYQYNLPLAFEANAVHSYETGNFQQSFDEAMRWHDDEPYSTRPIKVASYVSSIFLKEHKKSIKLIRKALEMTPLDVPLTNNLIYFLAQDNQIGEACKEFEIGLKHIVDNVKDYKDRVSYIATAGLIAFRTNKPSEGKMYYEKAISLARSSKNNYHLALATVNYVKEALKFTKSNDERSALVKQLDSVCEKSKELDIQLMYKETLTEYVELSLNT